MIASGRGKYLGFELNGTERTTLVDIFNIIHKVRDTGIHLKGYIAIAIYNSRPKTEEQ